jgi:tetratricopeptide (TPR) repeat protein
MSAGFLALTSGQFVQAAQAGEEVLRSHRSFGDAWVLLCSALIKMESTDDQRALEDALAAISPTDPARLPLTVELTRVLARRGRCARAVSIANQLAASLALTPNYHEALGSAYGIAGLFEKSLVHTSEATKAEPEHPGFLYAHGLTLRYLGKLDEAEQALDRVIALNPRHALAYFSRADLKRWSVEDNHIDEIRAVLASGKLSARENTQLEFALFKELDDNKKYDEAWLALSRGCELAGQENKYSFTLRRDAAHAATDEYRGIKPNAAKPALGSPTPIFVIGLPRSGTTLVERILARHSDVTSMGETQSFPIAFRDVAAIPHGMEIDASAIRRSANIDWTRVRDEYLANVEYLSGNKRYCTDKLPHNYEFVGQIMQAFPNAKIVNLTRNPLDSLLGAYRVLFGAGSYTWSYNQTDLADAYRVYRHLTDSWRTAFGAQFIDVALSALIEDPETTIRQLLSDLDLEFQPDCLSPEKSSGGVSTASSVQVRSPINSSGVGVWRNYAKQLEPLRRQLEIDGFVDKNGDQTF